MRLSANEVKTLISDAAIIRRAKQDDEISGFKFT